MSRFLLLFLLLFGSTFASEYPQTFSKLGTPLYKSLKPISKYSEIELLQENILTYEQLVNKTIAHGFEVDKSKDKAEIKKYLFELRKLQKNYDFLLHLLHDNINKAIDNKEYKLFLELTNYEFDGLLKNSNLRNKAMEFYTLHRAEKRSKVLEKKKKFAKLMKESTQEFYNQTVQSTYDPNAKQDSTKTVQIEVNRVGDNIYVVLKNRNIFDVTVSVKSRYENITESPNTPKVIVLKAQSSRSYTKLYLGKGKRQYSYSYRWIIGNKDAVHDDSYIYKLPYKTGTTHRVTQGYNGRATHKDSSQYSVDFAMDEGTKIYAARGGIVVKTKSDSDVGGFSEEFAKYGNYVTIAHEDGTLGTYYHLKYGGVLVRVGDVVQRGYALGYSGNTGYSSGPHLHFSVFSAVSAQKTHTIPTKFSSADGVIQEPIEGALYEAK